MERPSRANVQCIRVRSLPAVIEMPSRRNRLARRRSNLVQMPSPAHRAESRANVVVEMPTARMAPAPGANAKMKVSSAALSCGLRIAMMALAALFGWPRPTRDNDPGPASAARPWRMERVSAVGGSRLPATAAPLPGGLIEPPAASLRQTCAAKLARTA